ncbi:hypothetical protein BDZ89DRAFT_946218 [Hymenopellis radicata]|nr:hypothetical protein BDZ89DRAFT_946218 [Hymenopellis radicata]
MRSAVVVARNSARLFSNVAQVRRISLLLTRRLTVGKAKSGCVFVDSVFPIQVGRFDVRRYIGDFKEEGLLHAVRARFAAVKAHNFTITSVEPHPKDGGVFVHFDYNASDDSDALRTIEHDLRQQLKQDGALPSWLGLGTHAGQVWLVKGTPWKEDMNRYASRILKVSFEGPDVHEEVLYGLLRPYGRIGELSEPKPVPAGTPRSATVTFRTTRSAAIARNVLHGLSVQSGSTSSTKLRTMYEDPIQGHAVRDWISSHPRIVLPVLLTLLGTLTYTIFDPIRALMIQAKVEDWFEFRENKIYQWLRTNTYDRIYTTTPLSYEADVWKERQEAAEAVKTYLRDLPTTIAFIHGPQGSGKTTMLKNVLRGNERKTLVVDCRPLLKAISDTQLLKALANQTGYWPLFSFLNSVNHLIDLASVGLIGQKAGFSSSVSDQLHDILTVTTEALKNVSSSHRNHIRKQMKEEEKQQSRNLESARRESSIRKGTWHDGRLDCVAGNGVMSELGIGDELFGDGEEVEVISEVKEDERQKQRSAEDVEAVESLPIVIVRNYESKGGASKDELMAVIAQWAANLAESQIAHVIVISDNRENMKRLTKALPTKPLNLIALDDADSKSALAFLRQKLKDADIDLNFSREQTNYIERLGGRASDLESLIHKMRSGQAVEEAVEDIINRGVGEIQKSAFGDDAEDAKTLPWTREQAWIVMKKLASQPEISYSEVLLDFPFKGDETPLRNMEHAELIAMGTHNGRPSTIKPGKPIFRYAFQRLAQDPIFQATQDLAFNEKVIAGAESNVKAYEDELLKLKDMGADTGFWASIAGTSTLSQRARYLLDKIRLYQTKIESLERKNAGLKRVLANVGSKAVSGR